MNFTSNRLYVYTDGACSNNGYDNAIGGYGWAVFDKEAVNPKVPLAVGGARIKPCTNNIAELCAAIDGVRAVEALYHQLGWEYNNIEVYIDSAYISNCYKERWFEKWQVNGWVNSKKQPVANKELWSQLIPYFNNPIFTFKKVKGHATIFENNFVDELAVAYKTSSIPAIWPQDALNSFKEKFNAQFNYSHV